MENKRTISKHFDDEEIYYRLPNGDLYLKPDVKRKTYDKSDVDLTGSEFILDTQINYYALAITKAKEANRKNEDYNPDEELDNWLTE